MNRRSFIQVLGAVTGALLIPYEPKRVYSFARDLKVPEPFFDLLGWHRFRIQWDGTKMQGLIDDHVVAESNEPRGIWFESDGVESGWRGRVGEPLQGTEHLLVEKGYVLFDYGYHQRIVPSSSTTPNFTEVLLKGTEATFDNKYKLRLGYGNVSYET